MQELKAPTNTLSKLYLLLLKKDNTELHEKYFDKHYLFRLIVLIFYFILQG
jgi:hypothetical protein